MQAQQWLGISSSNYAGTYNIYSNPANIADSRYKFFLNVAGGNVEFTNNYAGWAAPYSFFGVVTNTVPSQYRASNGLIGFRNSYIEEAVNKPNTVAFGAVDVKGPSMFYTFEKAKLAIGFTSRLRVLNNLANTTSDVAHIMAKGTFLPTLYGVPQTNNHFTMNLNSYTEMGLSLGFVVREQDQDFFKVGLTLKRLNGLLNVHYLANNLDYTITQTAGRPTRQDILFSNVEGTFGMTSSNGFRSASFDPNWLFGNLAAGTGYGFDIGVVYEFRPDFDKYDIKIKGKWQSDGTKNKYLYRIGVALVDVGQINFNNPNYVNVTSFARTNVMVLPGTFNKIDSPERLYNQTNNAFNLSPSDYQHSFVSVLPMAFSANFDYKISEKIYLNSTWIQSLRNPNKSGMVQASMFAIIPRFETKRAEVSLPIALQNGYKNFTIGLLGRIGPIFLGTDNLMGILNVANPKGISAYFGLFLPIFRSLPDVPNGCYVESKTTLRQELRNVLNKRKQKRRWNNIR